MFSFSGCEDEEQGQWMDGYSRGTKFMRAKMRCTSETPSFQGT
jgi:hypothetical protein